MTVDVTDLGALVAGAMEEIEGTYSEEAQLGTFALIVEIDVADGDVPGYTHIVYRCNDNRSWVQAGLFDAAKRAAQNPVELNEDENE